MLQPAAGSLTVHSVSQSDDVTGLTFLGVNSPCRSQWLPLRLLVICPARPRPPAASLRWFSVDMKVPRDGKGCLAPRPKPCCVEMTSSAREERGNILRGWGLRATPCNGGDRGSSKRRVHTSVHHGTDRVVRSLPQSSVPNHTPLFPEATTANVSSCILQMFPVLQTDDSFSQKQTHNTLTPD